MSKSSGRGVESWSFVGATARRLYDESGHLLAAEWRQRDGSVELYSPQSRPQLEPRAEPPRRLVKWQKVPLQPGASQSVTIEVDQNDSSLPLSYWDTGRNAWTLGAGTYTVYLGDSDNAAKLQTVGSFTVTP